MPIIGVYQIINKKTGKMYIGSSIEVQKRLDRHKRELRKGIHHCIYLQRSWDKYGEKVFEFRVIQECLSIEDIRKAEQQYLKALKEKLYNTSNIASGGDLISYHPNKEKIVMKMKQSLKLRYQSMSPEDRKKVYGSHVNGMTGRTHTEEVKKKISAINKGNSYAKGSKRTPEQRAKLSKLASQRTGEKNPFYGKKHTEELKKNASKRMKGRLPPNTRRVVADGIEYESASEAGRHLGVVTATILNRIKSRKFPGYKYSET